jgi:hypothetical protein
MGWTLLLEGDTGAQRNLLDPSRPERRHTSPQSSHSLLIGITLVSWQDSVSVLLTLSQVAVFPSSDRYGRN